MTDIQILTIAIAIVFPVVAVLYSNHRISDLRDVVSARINDLRDSVNQRLDDRVGDLKETINARFDKMEIKMDTKMDALTEHLEMRFKLHELEHHGKKPQ